MDINEIRLENLEALIEERGTIAGVASNADTAANYLSQLINREKTPTGNQRKLGDKLARKLERGMGKPHGWMDVTHSNDDSDGLNYINIHYNTLDEGQRRRMIEDLIETVEFNRLKSERPLILT